MAEKKTLQKVDNQLNCSICLDTYTNPKLFQCFHVYCQKCLVKLVVRDQQGQPTLTCPICRQITPIPANGVAGLQSAFHINHLLEIMDEHKKATDPSAGVDRIESDSKSLTPSGKVIVCCREHVGKEAELYCETCDEVVCLKCVIKRGGKHHGHDCKELNEAYEQYKEEITASLEPMEKQVISTNKALAQLDTRCRVISDRQAAIEANIDKTIRQLHEILDVRKTELIGQLHQITQGKLKGLAVQRDQLETTQAQLCSCLYFVRESCNTNSRGGMLMMKTDIVKQVRELTTPFQPDMLEPNTEVDMIFSASTDMTAVCQNYGKVFAPGLPDPSQCHATGKGLEVAAVGEKSTAILQAINFNGQPCEEPIMSSECKLVSEITGTTARGSIERGGHSQYEISYQPTIKGRHQLHVIVEGQHIRGSPFSVTAKSPVDRLGTPILSTIGGMKGPWGVAISQRGEVVVTEFSAHCVSVFSPCGDKLRSFDTCGSRQGQFNFPRGVALDGEKNILVVDRDNHRIHKFTAEGQFLAAVGTGGKGPLKFSHPNCIAFNASNNMVYVTDNNHQVQVLNSDLTFSSTFGKEGNGKGQFSYPRGVACDSTGKVYVADADNHRIQVFTAEGKFLRMFGRCGAGRSELYLPFGIAIDTSDIVYVSECTNHRVCVFTSEGQFVKSFGRRGEGPGEFHDPFGLAVDNSGVVCVCDFTNNRIQMI